eukprot:359486_1
MTFNISSTDVPNENSVKLWQFALGSISISVILLSMLTCNWHLKWAHKWTPFSWAELSDLDFIPSSFKSVEVVQIYLSQQSLTKEMIMSNLFLFFSISLNIFTNSKTFWHYNNKEFLNGELSSLIIGSHATWLLAGIEFVMNIHLILTALIYCLCNYDRFKSVLLTVTMLPGFS